METSFRRSSDIEHSERLAKLEVMAHNVAVALNSLLEGQQEQIRQGKDLEHIASSIDTMMERIEKHDDRISGLEGSFIQYKFWVMGIATAIAVGFELFRSQAFHGLFGK